MPSRALSSSNSVVSKPSLDLTRLLRFSPARRDTQRARVFLSPGHSATEANTSRKRRQSFSQESPLIRRLPPASDTSTTPVRANTSRRRKGLSNVHPPSPPLLPFPGSIQLQRVEAIKILCEERIRCDISTVKVKPSKNEVAQNNPRYDNRVYQLKPWRQQHGDAVQERFLRAIRKLLDHAPTLGLSRILENETDAKEAFVVNTLVPILPILNDLLFEQYRHLLEVQLFSEAQQLGHRTRVDTSIMLVDTLKNAEGLRTLKLRKLLVFIEAKRHDLVSSEDWPPIGKSVRRQLGNTELNMRVILPQLLMYADSRCSRAILTDESDTIIFDIDLATIATPEDAVSMSYLNVSSRTGAEDVFSYGPRLAITYQIFQALLELGVLNPEIYAHEQPQLDHQLSRYLHPECHSSASPPPPVPPPKKAAENVVFTKPWVPPARKTRNSSHGRSQRE